MARAPTVAPRAASRTPCHSVREWQTTQFKQPIAILSGTWSFTPTLDNYADVLLSKRSDFLAGATVQVVVAKFAQDYEIQHGQMAAASILATIPALVLMVFGRRFIVQGLTMGSVK